AHDRADRHDLRTSAGDMEPAAYLRAGVRHHSRRAVQLHRHHPDEDLLADIQGAALRVRGRDGIPGSHRASHTGRFLHTVRVQDYGRMKGRAMRFVFKRFTFRVFLYVAALLIAVWVLAPYAWLIISSISTKIDLLNVPLKWIPSRPTLENYRSLFADGQSALSQGMSFFSRSMLNSIIVTFSSMAICMFFGVFTAYAVARLTFPGRKFYLMMLMGSYMMPPIAIVIPGYIILKSLHLLDSRIGLALVNITFILPLVVWIMRGFFLSIPLELEEA